VLEEVGVRLIELEIVAFVMHVFSTAHLKVRVACAAEVSACKVSTIQNIGTNDAFFGLQKHALEDDIAFQVCQLLHDIEAADAKRLHLSLKFLAVFDFVEELGVLEVEGERDASFFGDIENKCFQLFEEVLFPCGVQLFGRLGFNFDESFETTSHLLSRNFS